MNNFQRIAKTINAVVTPLLHVPWIGARLSRSVAVITYIGRRSGATFSTPVNYVRDGDALTIGVMMPERKNWWRNFYPEAAPISVTIGGVERHGTAVAERDETGARVKVVLDPAFGG